MKNFLNLMKKTKVKMVIILSILFFIYTTLCAFSYAESVSTDIANSVFRLHVIANSDTKEDQDLKYIVRDHLLEYMNTICKDCTSKKQAIQLVEENKDIFQNIALETIQEQGYSYSVKINIGNFEFPTKTYGDISLPAGYYDALRVEIGEAKGQNWWCVMFPPLCFVDITTGVVPEQSKEELKDNMSEEEFALVSDQNDSEIQFKFKLIEFFTQKRFYYCQKIACNIK